MLSRTKEDLEKIKKHICKHGRKAYYKVLDVNKTLDVESFVKKKKNLLTYLSITLEPIFLRV